MAELEDRILLSSSLANRSAAAEEEEEEEEEDDDVGDGEGSREAPAGAEPPTRRVRRAGWPARAARRGLGACRDVV